MGDGIYHAETPTYNQRMPGHVYRDISELVTMDPPSDPPADGGDGLGLVRDAAFFVRDGRVAWYGPATELPEQAASAATTSLEGRAVLPGLVDPHTHLVYAGDRTGDFEARCSGQSYEAIAAAGGGIRLTVRETRAASLDTLVEAALPRLNDLLRHGVTTVEIKSGYGLTVADELKLLEAAARLDQASPCRVVSTVLGAHVVPDAFRQDRAGYLSLLHDELLPEVAARGLARFVDVFCDVGAFSLDETLSILERGRELGFALKVHAEQLTHTGASGAAARLGAVSADHLEQVSAADIDALAAAGTVAVLLPGAGLFLGAGARPPARALIAAGVQVALATDCNPGTCPTRNLPLIVTLGCCLLGLTPAEALQGVTVAAAAALGLDDGRGSLAVGAPADFVQLSVDRWRHLPYELGMNPVRAVWVAGQRAIGPTEG